MKKKTIGVILILLVVLGLVTISVLTMGWKVTIITWVTAIVGTVFLVVGLMFINNDI